MLITTEEKSKPHFKRKIVQNMYLRTIKDYTNTSKVRSFIVKEILLAKGLLVNYKNAQCQLFAKYLMTKIWNLKRTKKHNDHRLSPRDIAERRRRCRRLYENHLSANEKEKFCYSEWSLGLIKWLVQKKKRSIIVIQEEN